MVRQGALRPSWRYAIHEAFFRHTICIGSDEAAATNNVWGAMSIKGKEAGYTVPLLRVAWHPQGPHHPAPPPRATTFQGTLPSHQRWVWEWGSGLDDM
jgi:hypothetical protein